MNRTDLTYILTWLGMGCWGACFWWMHRISTRQDGLMQELRDQGKRIEQLSREEHALIKEVHPKVSDIKEQMDQVAREVKK